MRFKFGCLTIPIVKTLFFKLILLKKKKHFTIGIVKLATVKRSVPPKISIFKNEIFVDFFDGHILFFNGGF